MRKLLAIGFLLLPWMVRAASTDVVTLTVTITNQPADTETFVLNGNTRTWKGTVVTPSTQIATNATIGGSATNLFQQIASYPFTGPFLLGFSSSNVVTLRGPVGLAITASESGTWGVLTLSTNTATAQKVVATPFSAYPTATDRTNIASGLITALQLYPSNVLAAGSAAFTNYTDNASDQTMAGAKTWTGANSFSSSGSSWVNGSFYNVTLANLLNFYGLTNNGLMYFGSGLTDPSYAIAPDANGAPSVYTVTINGALQRVLGTFIPYVPKTNNVLTYSTAALKFGDLTNFNTWTQTNYFYNAQITNLSLAYLVSPTASSATLTNTIFIGTNTLTGDLALTKSANYSSLANGNNATIDFGNSSFIKLTSGPSAGFTICGIAGGRSGRVLKLYNNTGQNMTIANQSGVEPTAANRIVCMSGADVATTADGFCELIYDDAASRWLLEYLTP